MQAITPDLARGTDVSLWQGAVDWSAVKAAGITFGVAEATNGATGGDARFASDWQGMRADGLFRSAYHFGLPCDSSANVQADAELQAHRFVATINAAGGYHVLGGDLPLALDIEQNPKNLPAAELRAWCEFFCNTVDALLGLSGPRATMIYGGGGLLANMMQGQPSALAQRGLWLAEWGVNDPANLGPWTRWTAIQTSQSGHIPGINGPVDTDVWCLTPAQMEAMYGGAPTPTGPKVMLWQHASLQVVAETLAQQYGWQATSNPNAATTAGDVLCVGGAPDWIAAAKAACRGTWHAPLAGANYWATLALVAEAGSTGRF